MRQPTEGQGALEPVVVDTDVISYLFKGDTRADRYEPLLIGHAVVLSFMSIAELDAWVAQRNWGQRARQRLERYLTRFAVHFPDRDLCRVWAGVMTVGRRAGRPIGAADAWIAATALYLGASLVTHNPSDYAGVPGLNLLTAV